MITQKLHSDYQVNIAQQLTTEGIGSISDNILKLTDDEIYQLEKEQLAQLGITHWFDGFMEVDMIGTKDFSVKFSIKNPSTNPNALPRTRLRTAEVIGCQLINGNEKFLLPQSMFELNQLITEKKFTEDEAVFWQIIEKAKNNEDSRIEFTGLPKENIISYTTPIEIDLQINADNSTTVVPHIAGLSDKSNEQYKYSLLDSQGMKVLSEVKTGEKGKYQIRYITDKKTVQAFQRVNSIGTIAKENVAKFINNPSSFILEGDESVDDVPISFEGYRIIGMGKPYAGYFGSSPLDTSPMAKALMIEGHSRPINDFKAKIASVCDGKSLAEVTEYKNKLETAKMLEDETCIIDADEEGKGGIQFNPITYSIGIDTFNKVLKEVNSLADDEKSTDKIVISIKPNDDNEIEISASLEDTRFKKPLKNIATNNLEKADLFTAIKPQYPPKSYQIAGVNWIIDLYNSGYYGGILADDMGLGKTYQVIAFLSYLYKNIKSYQTHQKRILIVAPTVLLDNWKNEIEKFLIDEIYQDLQVHIVRGSDLKKRREIEKTAEGSYNTFNVEEFLQRKTDIIITTYETLSNYQFPFTDKMFNWGCVIYDEAHKIKNPNAQISQASRALSSKTDFSLLLTGTPIENELRDLWALFDVFAPTHFGSWKKFREEFVKSDATSVDKRLRKKASNYILRRLKKDYLTELPEKIDKVHEFEFFDHEQQRYLQYRTSSEKALERLHKLKAFSLCGDILLESLEIGNQIKLTDFSKMKKLLEVLKNIENNNEKVIIFAISRVAQSMLQYAIKKYFNIEADIINGNSNQSTRVQNILKKFNQSKGFNVLILSTLSAGIGLTITSANHVIHYERWWNASKEDQASDRAYRIGQNKDVYIHYLIAKLTKNTENQQEAVSIDEAVHQLIALKKETAGFLVPPKGISTADVIDRTITTNVIEKVASLSPKEFEMLVMNLYQKQGYDCYLTPDGKREYGADIIAKKDIDNHKEIIAIQCKHTAKEHKPNEKAVIQLAFEAKEHYSATQFIAVTNFSFNSVAHDMAEKQGVLLLEKDELFSLIEQFGLEEI